MIITLSNIKIKNTKIVTKNCESVDYFFENVFLFNEVNCWSKNQPIKTSSYQYFTQLYLDKSVALDLATEYQGFIHKQGIQLNGKSVNNKYFVYFSNIDRAIEFCNSNTFEKLTTGHSFY